MKSITCPHCNEDITVDSHGNVIPPPVDPLANMHVSVPAPSKEVIAQARFDRDVKVGKPVVEIPAGVKVPEPHHSKAPDAWVFVVIVGVPFIMVLMLWRVYPLRTRRW